MRLPLADSPPSRPSRKIPIFRLCGRVFRLTALTYCLRKEWPEAAKSARLTEFDILRLVRELSSPGFSPDPLARRSPLPTLWRILRSLPMDVFEAVATRYSCRAFLPTPVPEKVVKRSRLYSRSRYLALAAALPRNGLRP
jgi:hypothetical protein